MRLFNKAFLLNLMSDFFCRSKIVLDGSKNLWNWTKTFLAGQKHYYIYFIYFFFLTHVQKVLFVQKNFTGQKPFWTRWKPFWTHPKPLLTHRRTRHNHYLVDPKTPLCKCKLVQKKTRSILQGVRNSHNCAYSVVSINNEKGHLTILRFFLPLFGFFTKALGY